MLKFEFSAPFCLSTPYQYVMRLLTIFFLSIDFLQRFLYENICLNFISAKDTFCSVQNSSRCISLSLYLIENLILCFKKTFALYDLLLQKNPVYSSLRNIRHIFVAPSTFLFFPMYVTLVYLLFPTHPFFQSHRTDM